MMTNGICMIAALFGSLGLPEILLIALIILLLFGGKKIPELMKGLGKGVRSFKQGLNEVNDEINAPEDGENKNKSDLSNQQKK